MKIGILTFHNIPNIGALLQAQSLCKYIRDLGFDCDIIDYRCDNIKKRELEFRPSDNFFRNILLKLAWRKNLKKIAACNDYMRNLQLISDNTYDRSNIRTLNDTYDTFISGSDMIWNLKVTGTDFTYFLDFSDEEKVRLSYASSIGDTWTEEELSMVKPLLKRYYDISVRESDTCSLLNRQGFNCHHTFDPTILVDPDEWKKVAIRPTVSNYVLVYFPSPYLITVAKQYARKYQKKVVVISQGVPSIGIKKVSPLNPPEWLGLIMNSDTVFTNSFHGLLFSLYFEKNVWTANSNNRIVSILEDLGIKECLLTKEEVIPDYKIDFFECKQLINTIRTRSRKYLDDILSEINQGKLTSCI